MREKRVIIAFIVLQVALFILSIGAVCSKIAANQKFMSRQFIVFYGLVLVILFIYAIIWQQVLRYLPLIVAYASKGVGILYGILWGVLFFNENIKWNMIVGAFLVLVGVYTVLFGELKESKRNMEIES